MTKSVEHNLMESGTQHFRQADHIASMTTAALPSPFKDLTFPLNVYAHALLQEGKAACLHYGLFQNNETSLQTAQQFSTDLLMTRLPPPPCRILEVGVGLGTTLSLLNQHGYDVHGITPDAHQIAYIQKFSAAKAYVSCQSLGDFKAEADSFDVILFQESARYIDPLVIFNKALDLLPQSGNLLIIDEFALKYDSVGIEDLHLLNDLVALAERFGFELVEHMDLSAMAAPSLDYLLSVTMTHRHSLMKDLSLSYEQLDQLNESSNAHQKKFASGYYGYALLQFSKKNTPKWRIRTLEKNQVPEMLGLFKKTFGHGMTPTTWQWKYGSNSGHEIVIWSEHRLIGHYGGIQRDILLFGEPQIAVQISDVMVDISERGFLTKKNPFFLMTATFLERYIGYGKPCLIGFGFPNERHMKVAERHGLYGEVEKMVEISWPPLSRLPQWLTRLTLVNQIDDALVTLVINDCWQQMANDLQNAIVGVRNWDYLQHRYLNHPNQHYQVVLVKNRFSKRIRGVLVLRQDADECELVDIVSALAEIPLLIMHARRLAGINHAKRVFCLITDNFARHFATPDCQKRSLNISIPTNIWGAGPSTESLKNNWWLMSGDTDSR